jgi:hypothetical protein
MKTLAAALLLGASTLAVAGTPPSLQPFLDYGNYYAYDDETKQWKFETSSMECQNYVTRATEDGVADTLVVEVPWDTPLWKKGPHTFKELKDYCAHARKADAVRKMVGWMQTARNDDQGDIAVACQKFYRQLSAEHDVPGTTRLPYEGIGIQDPATGDPFSGTVEDARKKFCDPKAQKYLAAVAAEEAPYRKALKGDKLDVALGALGKAVYGPGRKELKTPDQMAAGNLWFRVIWYDDTTCEHGRDKVYVVHRYQFDGSGKLSQKTSRNYCGNPPAAAFQ